MLTIVILCLAFLSSFSFMWWINFLSEVHWSTPIQVLHFPINTNEVLSHNLIALLFVLVCFQAFYKVLKLIHTKRMEGLFEALQFFGIEFVWGAWDKLFVFVLISSFEDLSFLFGLKGFEVLLILWDGLWILGDVEYFVFDLSLLTECHFSMIIFYRITINFAYDSLLYTSCNVDYFINLCKMALLICIFWFERVKMNIK